jgi:hypothetical protein
MIKVPQTTGSVEGSATTEESDDEEDEPSVTFDVGGRL